MNAWLALVIAIVAEVIATSALKASDGFSRLGPSLLVVAGYAVAFYFLAVTLKTHAGRHCLCGMVRRGSPAR